MGVASANYTCLSMCGIPMQATEVDITHFFQDAQVIPVRIHRKANGGEAFIEFNSPVEVASAMNLQQTPNGQQFQLTPVDYDFMAQKVGLPPRAAASALQTGPIFTGF